MQSKYIMKLFSFNEPSFYRNIMSKLFKKNKCDFNIMPHLIIYNLHIIVDLQRYMSLKNLVFHFVIKQLDKISKLF